MKFASSSFYEPFIPHTHNQFSVREFFPHISVSRHQQDFFPAPLWSESDEEKRDAMQLK